MFPSHDSIPPNTDAIVRCIDPYVRKKESPAQNLNVSAMVIRLDPTVQLDRQAAGPMTTLKIHDPSDAYSTTVP